MKERALCTFFVIFYFLKMWHLSNNLKSLKSLLFFQLSEIVFRLGVEPKTFLAYIANALPPKLHG